MSVKKNADKPVKKRSAAEVVEEIPEDWKQDKLRAHIVRQSLHPRYRFKVAAAVIFTLMALLFLVIFLPKLMIPQQLSGEADGTIAVTSLAVSRGDKLVTTEHTVAIYKVGSAEYSTTSGTEAFRPNEGDKVKVFYNPSNPADAKVRMSLKQLLLLSFAYLVLPTLLILSTWKFIINRN